ncbi:MAG: hypothetical protein RL325_1517 [Planctomycetota bacterium]|jgi:hypothetical protein
MPKSSQGGAPRKPEPEEGGRLMAFGEGIAGTIAALAVTLVIAYIVALCVLFVVRRILPLGSFGGWEVPILALILTVAFYLYDREHR